jgi:L-ascorbate metabolism protein UlaG (beta-lactamase superfamily)
MQTSTLPLRASRFIGPISALIIALAGCSSSTSSTNDAGTVGKTSTSATPNASADEVVDSSVGPIEVHPIHHATVWIKVKDQVVWIDPTSDGSLEGPKADVILVTHEHPDHFDPKAIDKVKKPDAHIITTATIAEKLQGAIVMKNGDQRDEGAIHIEAIAAYNLKRGPKEGALFHEKGNGNGYVLSVGGKRIYFSGDTECTDEMRALKDIDVAFVCMNLPYTMPVSEAAECVKVFKPKVLVPYHYKGQNLDELDTPLSGSGVAIHKHDFYK